MSMWDMLVARVGDTYEHYLLKAFLAEMIKCPEMEHDIKLFDRRKWTYGYFYETANCVLEQQCMKDQHEE